jgi:hypothetical protein
MARFSGLFRTLFSATLLAALASCSGSGDGGGSSEGQPQRTMLTLETPSRHLKEAWPYLRADSFEYRIALADEADPADPLEGELELVAGGAANYVERGEPTDVLRAWVDLPPGRHSIAIRMRDQDREVIFSLSAPLRVASDVPTEWYYFFDPRTFDPPPVFRNLVLNVDTPKALDSVGVERVEYSISCGLDDVEFLKTSYACGTSSEGSFELVGEGVGGLGGAKEAIDLWRATHEVGCGPCRLTVNARDAAGASLCFAELSFDVEGWRNREMPPEQVHLPLICTGGSE